MARAAPGLRSAALGVSSSPASRRYPAARRARRRRTLGRALLAFGATGLLLIGVAALLLLGSIGAISDAATGFERQRGQIVDVLGPAADTLSQAGTSATNASDSLQASGEAAGRAAGLTTRLADAFDGMAALGSFDVLGARPFGGVAGQFAEVGAESRALSVDLAAAATSLQTNVADSKAIAEHLRTLSTRLTELKADVAASGGVGGAGLPLTALVLVLGGLLAWFAVPAALSAWLGWRLLRTAARAPDWG